MNIIKDQAKQTVKGPDGLTLKLDAAEIFPNDPGQGTPAILELGRYAATFNCAYGEGEVEGTELTDDQAHWLGEIADSVDEWLTYHWDLASKS